MEANRLARKIRAKHEAQVGKSRLQSNNTFHLFNRRFCATVPSRRQTGEGSSLSWAEDRASWKAPWIQLFFPFCRLAAFKRTKTLTYGHHGEGKRRRGLTLNRVPLTVGYDDRGNSLLLHSTLGLNQLWLQPSNIPSIAGVLPEVECKRLSKYTLHIPWQRELSLFIYTAGVRIPAFQDCK